MSEARSSGGAGNRNLEAFARAGLLQKQEEEGAEGVEGQQGEGVAGKAQRQSGNQAPTGAEGAEQGQGAEGAEAAAAPRTAEQVAAELADREAKVSTDGYGLKIAYDLGPQDARAPTEGFSTETLALIEESFNNGGEPSPFNANTTPQVTKQANAAVQYGAAKQAFQTYIETGASADLATFRDKMKELSVIFPDGNIMEILVGVFRDSIEEINLDREMHLDSINRFNQMAEGLNDYLKELVKYSDNLAEAEKGAEPGKATVTIPVSFKEFEPLRLDDQGKLIATATPAKSVNRQSLGTRMKQLEATKETLKNKRQEVTVMFQSADQKRNQLSNLMTQAVKITAEMRGAAIKNML